MSNLDTTGENTAPAGNTAPEKRQHLATSELLFVVLIGLIPVAFSTEVFAAYWSPKAALILCAIIPGAVALARGCRALDHASLAAVAFLGVSGVSTLMSDNPLLSFIGLYNSGGAWLFYLAMAGVWALARDLTSIGRNALAVAFVMAGLLNAVVGWVQLTVPDKYLIQGFNAISQGRSHGMLGNPVFLGGFLAATLWVFSWRGANKYTSNKFTPWKLVVGYVFGLALLGGAIQLSGTRAALVTGFVGSGLSPWLARRDLSRLVRSLLCVVAMLAVGSGIVVAPHLARDTGGGATDRLVPSRGESFDTRFGMWDSGVEALTERPIVGWGPGRFRTAGTSHADLEFVLKRGPDTLDLDAHNIVVEVAVATGIIGTAAAGAWAFFALRRVRGMLLGIVFIMGVSALLQPLYLGTTIPLMAALGASGAPRRKRGAPRDPLLLNSLDAERVHEGRWPSRIAAAGMVVGAGFAIVLLIGDFNIARAYRDHDPTAQESAERFLPSWSRPLEIGMRIEITLAGGVYGDSPEALARRQVHLDRAVALANEAAHRDSTDPTLWTTVGGIESNFGSKLKGAAAYERALELNPWSFKAIWPLMKLAQERGDHELARNLECRVAALRRDLLTEESIERLGAYCAEVSLPGD